MAGWQLAAGHPALPPEDLGDLTDEVAAGDLAGKEPHDDVLTLPDEPVLPVRVLPYLALGAVELLRVDLDDQPAPATQVPGEIGATQEAAPLVEEVPLQVVRCDPGVVAAEPCVALGRGLGSPVGQR
ncbi:hypothetical protein GCM10010413_11380 [Promicromonospora sukumoe]|uniref:Uncharacterized protein n=1 Tax=Promicromonospora sukumoe TaxID=88382 RepID=A0A7W3PCR5_9MICO|nr:hypothetical protein [Promicromonospora sukumoe]MBA8806802.1 hypothetical protein [Promicromonospora sukumoe]